MEVELHVVLVILAVLFVLVLVLIAQYVQEDIIYQEIPVQPVIQIVYSAQIILVV